MVLNDLSVDFSENRSVVRHKPHKGTGDLSQLLLAERQSRRNLRLKSLKTGTTTNDQLILYLKRSRSGSRNGLLVKLHNPTLDKIPNSVIRIFHLGDLVFESLGGGLRQLFFIVVLQIVVDIFDDL